jgi:hypothetical protein
MGDYRTWSDEYPWHTSHAKPDRKPPSAAQQFEWTLKHNYGNARVSPEDRKTWLSLVDAEASGNSPPDDLSI